MRRIVKRLIAGLLALVVLAVVAVGAVVLLVDPSAWKGRIESRASDALGRTVTVAGPVSLEPGLTPALALQDVAIANLDGYSRPDLATIDRIEVAIPLSSLIAGDLVVDWLAIEGGDIRLERGPEGTANWHLGGAGNGSGGQPTLRRISLNDVQISLYRGEGQGRSLTIAAGTIAGADAEGRLDVDLTGSLDDREAALTGQVGDFRTLSGAGTVPLDLTFESRGTRLAASGSVDRSAQPVAVDLQIGIESPDAEALEAILGRRNPLVGSLSATAEVTGPLDRLQIAGLDAAVGDSALAGTLTLARDGDRPAVTGDLTAGRLDLADFGVGVPGGAGVEGSDSGLIPDWPLPVAWLAATDVDLGLEIDTLVLGPETIQGLTGGVEITGGAGTLTVDAGTVWQGDLAGTLSIDSTASPSAFRIDGRVAGLALEALLGADPAGRQLSGTADLAYTLRGAGDSLEGVIATLDGTAGLVSGQARLDSRWLDVVGRSIFTAVLPSEGEGVASRINCVVTRFDVTDGVGESTALLLDTPEVTVGGQGKVDLSAETLDIVLRPNPKNPQIAPLIVPVRVHGSLASPSVVPDPGEIIQDAATGLLLGAINPLALVVPLVNVGQTDDNPCIAALRGEGTDTGPSGPVGAATEGVGAVLQGVGKGLQTLFGAD